jgi:hypothetical protein
MLNLLAILGINAAALFLMYLYFRARIRRFLELDELTSKLKKEVGALILELNATTERNIGLIEDKISALQEAAALADKRLLVLNKELERKESSAGVYTSLGKLQRKDTPSRVPEPPSSIESAEYAQPVDSLPSEARELRRSLSGQPRFEPEPAASKAARVEISRADSQIAYEPSFREKVIELSKKGFSAALIASRLGSPLGEVELALSLSERAEDSSV